VTIPQASPLAQYLAHKDEIDAAIARVLGSGRYILGEEVERFETEFAAYVGVGYGVAVGSGTDALYLALRACGIGPGDEVITVPHTAAATVAAIELCGALPVFVDIDLGAYVMDPRELESAITQRTKAIIPVHLYGNPADMAGIGAIARRAGLWIVEDCAQSHGAAYRGRKTGAWGDVGAFSFYPTKNLGALGDGGMVVTNRGELAERVRSLREYGWRERYVSEIAGVNSRLDELQAAVLRVKLRYLDEENTRRRSLAHTYDGLLSQTGLGLPRPLPGSDPVYHQYVVRSSRRNELRAYLASAGIDTIVHYPVPVHLQPAYQHLAERVGALPNSEQAAREVLSLPLHPHLSLENVHEVARTIYRWCCGTAKRQ
jgi:dTDP-4-amino-4,6-dideoxygalactose transaminase